MSPDISSTLRWVSGIAAVTTIFLFAPTGDAYHWIEVTNASAAIVLIVGVLGLIASTGRVVFGLIGALICLLGAGAQLVTLSSPGQGLIGGNASTMALLLGVGLGLAILCLADRIPVAEPDTASD